MPAIYASAATAIAGAVAQTAGGTDSPSASGGSTGAQSNSMLAGGLVNALNPSPNQTQAGTFTPPAGGPAAYNYIPTGQGGVDQTLQGLLTAGGGPSNLMSGVSDPNSWYQYNPYGVDFSPGSGLSNWLNSGSNDPNAVRALGGNLVNSANSNLPAINQILQASFDPQQGLYNRTVNQLTDQVRAGEAARGLGATPFGAGVENKALSDFNIDWQNNQLGRMLQGIQGMNTGYQGIGQAGTTGTNLLNSGNQLFQSQLLMPHNLYQGLQQDYLKTAGGAALTDAQINAARAAPGLQYMQIGQTADANANRNALGSAELIGNQNANAAAGISSGLNSIMPWIGKGLGGLYDSIFNGSSASDTNPATGNSYATDAAPGPNQIEPM